MRHYTAVHLIRRYRTLLLEWHIGLVTAKKEMYRKTIFYLDERQWVKDVAKDAPMFGIEQGHVHLPSLMMSVPGGKAELWGDDNSLIHRRYMVVPGDLSKWPVGWPGPDRGWRRPSPLREWGWMELCREGLCLCQE